MSLWGHSHISIGPCCCDRTTCWLMLTKRLVKWGWCTADYGCSLLLCLIKWLPVSFIGLVEVRRYVPSLFLSHSYMRYMVSVKFYFMLLPSLLVVCLCSIVRWKVLSGLPYIHWLWLIYPFSVCEPHDLSGPPYIRWLCLVCLFSFKIMKGLPRSPWNFVCLVELPCSVMWCTVFFLTSVSSLPCGSGLICNFLFFQEFIPFFIILLLVRTFAWGVASIGITN